MRYLAIFSILIVTLTACAIAASRTPHEQRTRAIERQCRAEAELEPEDARTEAYAECVKRYQPP